MRRSDWLAGMVAFIAAGLGAGVSACVFGFDTGNCEDYPKPGCPGVATTGSTTSTTGTGGTGGSTTSSGGGGTGGTMKVCPSDPTVASGEDLDGCGVFVSAAAASGGDGTLKKPFNTLADAANSGAKQVYVCAEAYIESKPVKFMGGVKIFAVYAECDTGKWSPSATTPAQVTTSTSALGFSFQGGENEVVNLSVTSPKATIPGDSSIAVVVNGGSLDMKSGAITAGDALAGDKGSEEADNPALNGDSGANGIDACGGGATHPGAPAKTKMCTTGGMSVSGKGGDGGTFSMPLPAAGSGGDGSPADASQPTKGKGGTGEGAGTPAASSCDVGQPGANGAVGLSGEGAIGAGAVTAKIGYQGAPGKDGANGKPGQGGGGGGGSKGAPSVVCQAAAVDVIGASGGAGGTGGCGGTAGGGGKPGGSSIALLVVDAKVTLGSGVMLTSGAGGAGGAGGKGQSGGQKGGNGAAGGGTGAAIAACAGGTGGQGGAGGPGGGGQGGHSLGIAFQTSMAAIPPPSGGMFTVDPAKKGAGGDGGNNSMAAGAGKGAGGVAEQCWDFGQNAKCL